MPSRSTSSSQAPFLPTLRELVRCYQAFESYSAAHIRRLGLTPPQFDVIATLGNTTGMSCKELGERTLITKGTLTGILDRLAAKGVLRRIASETDGRSFRVELTRQGQDLFEQIFPDHLAHLRPAFDRLGSVRLAALTGVLAQLREAFESSRSEDR